MIEVKKDSLPLSVAEVENHILYGDVLDCLRVVPDKCVHVVACSPPYNLSLNYGNYSDNAPWKDYLEWLFKVWQECCRVLVSGGRLVINIDSITNRQDPDESGEYIRPILAELVFQMRKIPGMMYRAEITWAKDTVVGRATAWGSWMSASNPIIRRNHEHLLTWSKDTWRIEGDSELSDMTRKEFEQWTMSTWYITPETRNLGGHPAAYPEELVRRIIKLYSYRGNIILDPFSGTGTTCAVALREGRKYIGIDNYLPYVEFAEKRIKKEESMNSLTGAYEPRSSRLKSSKKSTIKRDKETEMDML